MGFPAHERLKLRLPSRSFKPRECQMRSEGSGLTGKAQVAHGILDFSCKLGQAGQSLESRPEHARPAGVRKEPETFDLHPEFFEALEGTERVNYFSGLLLGNFPEELERQMDSLRPRPANFIRGSGGPRASGAE